jgi:hypothetical protein
MRFPKPSLANAGYAVPEIMNTKTEQSVKGGRGRIPEVTPEEIAVTERILQSIDLNSQIVASVSQWILIWQNVRELSFRIEASPIETQQNVAESFRRLLNESIRIGNNLAGLVENLGISAEHLRFATGCNTAGIAACVSLLEDMLEFYFGEPVSLDLVREVWAEFSE